MEKGQVRDKSIFKVQFFFVQSFLNQLKNVPVELWQSLTCNAYICCIKPSAVCPCPSRFCLLNLQAEQTATRCCIAVPSQSPICLLQSPLHQLPNKKNSHKRTLSRSRTYLGFNGPRWRFQSGFQHFANRLDVLSYSAFST